MNSIGTWIAVHRKLLVFIAGTVAELCVQVWGTANVYVALGILAATGLGIYQFPNAQVQGAEATVFKTAAKP